MEPVECFCPYSQSRNFRGIPAPKFRASSPPTNARLRPDRFLKTVIPGNQHLGFLPTARRNRRKCRRIRWRSRICIYGRRPKGGPPVELLDYTINNERRGPRYGGCLVVIKDSRGEVIAYQTPSENLYRNVDNLRNIHVGWYFDKDCNRCLPTPPEPWAEGGGN